MSGNEEPIPVVCPEISVNFATERNVMKKLKEEEASNMNNFINAATVAPTWIPDCLDSDNVPREWY
jgi:hypothetical protein